AVLILGSGLVGERWISHELFLFALIATTGILLIPRRYRLTSAGVSPNRATFRAWNEFKAWHTRGNVVRLDGAERFSSLKLYIAQADRERVLKLVGQYVPRRVAKDHAVSDHRGRVGQRLARTNGGTR